MMKRLRALKSLLVTFKAQKHKLIVGSEGGKKLFVGCTAAEALDNAAFAFAGNSIGQAG